MKGRHAPTLADVAREASVSPMVVSMVLNDRKSGVRASEETRRRVLEVAQRMRYRPNGLAQSLMTGTTNTIGVLFATSLFTVQSPHGYYGAAILEGLVGGCADQGYNLTLYTAIWDHVHTAASAYCDQRTDGMVVIAPDAKSGLVEAIVELDMQVVAISYPDTAKEPRWTSIDVNNRLGIELAVQHLANLGHRRIAHLAGPANTASGWERLEGFMTGMQRAGLVVDPRLVVPGRERGDSIVPGGAFAAITSYEDTRALLLAPEPPTALICGNDMMAAKALQAAADCGIAVPEQLSIIGFDDFPGASLLNPPLATVRQPLYELGAEAVRLLIKQIGQSQVQGDIRLTPELMVRGTTGPA